MRRDPQPATSGHPDIDLVNSMPVSTERQVSSRADLMRRLLAAVVAGVNDPVLTRHVALNGDLGEHLERVALS
jgi:hypothetical protein